MAGRLGEEAARGLHHQISRVTSPARSHSGVGGVHRSPSTEAKLDHLVFGLHTRNFFYLPLFGGFRFVVRTFDIQCEEFFDNLFVR
jgi:hypothetical protein